MKTANPENHSNIPTNFFRHFFASISMWSKSGKYPEPFEDMRRADSHRDGWAQKKVIRKNEERYRALREREKGVDGGFRNA